MESSFKMPENQQSKAVVDEGDFKTSVERQFVGRKAGGKSKSDGKASVQSAGSSSEGAKAHIPTEVKMPELRKPEIKPVVKNPKKKISKESPPSVPVKITTQSKEVAYKSDDLKLRVEAAAKPASDVKVESSLPSKTSNSIGLKVLSITSCFPGYVFTANDRAKLVRSIPGVVIINTANKGDKLVLGVDMEDDKLSSLLTQFQDQKNWNLSVVDTTDKDTFSYFAGWKLIPRVD